LTDPKINSDERGVLIELCDIPVHVNYITINRGKARGGHSHKYAETFLLLDGFVELIEPGIEATPIFAGESYTTKPDVPHAFYSPDHNSTLLEVRAGGIRFKARPNGPLRAWVNWINEMPLPSLPKCRRCGRFHETRDHVKCTGSKGRNVTSWK
jgi:hypothetical protein